MRTPLCRAALMAAIISTVANAQLYLITGARDQGFPMTLAKVTSAGTVQSLSELLPTWFMPNVKWAAPTVAWFAMSHQWRRALIVPYDPAKQIMVLDLDQVAVVKRCKVPDDLSPDYRWLADLPGKGLTFEWVVLRDDPTQSTVRGMIMDPALPCDQSFATVEPEEIKHIVSDGTAGIADIDARTGLVVNIDPNGEIVSGGVGPPGIKFGYKLPPDLRYGLTKPYTSIVINNAKILVLAVKGDPVASSQFLVFRKADTSWHRVPVQSDWYERLQGFGKFVALTEARVKKSIAVQKGKAMIRRGLKDEPGDESAGRKEWRKEPSATGPDLEIEFMNSAAVYPGRLHLYDVDTERLYTITTNQADSEVLLIENGTVYYRVSDRLYSASITDEGVGYPKLLATSDLIRDSHWAFTKH